MRNPGVLHNHQSTHARPDAKMSRQQAVRSTRKYAPTPPGTAVRQTEQKYANAKRRQRDRKEADAGIDR